MEVNGRNGRGIFEEDADPLQKVFYFEVYYRGKPRSGSEYGFKHNYSQGEFTLHRAVLCLVYCDRVSHGEMRLNPISNTNDTNIPSTHVFIVRWAIIMLSV